MHSWILNFFCCVLFFFIFVFIVVLYVLYIWLNKLTVFHNQAEYLFQFHVNEMFKAATAGFAFVTLKKKPRIQKSIQKIWSGTIWIITFVPSNILEVRLTKRRTKNWDYSKKNTNPRGFKSTLCLSNRCELCE